MIVEENPGTVVIGKGEFHGILGSGIEKRCGVEESERNESAVFVHGLGIHDVSVDGPHGTRDEEGVDRIVTDGIYIRENGTAGGPANLKTRDFPTSCGCGSAGDERKQKDGKEHGQNG